MKFLKLLLPLFLVITSSFVSAYPLSPPTFSQVTDSGYYEISNQDLVRLFYVNDFQDLNCTQVPNEKDYLGFTLDRKFCISNPDLTDQPLNKPTQSYLSIWSAYKISGDYYVPSASTFWRIQVLDNLSGTCTDNRNSGLYTYRYCTSSDNGIGKRVVYGDKVSYICPEGFSIYQDYCIKESVKAVYALDVPRPEVEICSDGFPITAGADFGYSTCDRPDLQKCSDASYALSSSICPDIPINESVCNSFLSCKAYAESANPCSQDQLSNYNFVSVDEFYYTCSDIPPDSPDHSSNGGNSDGDITNDPIEPNDQQLSEQLYQSLENTISPNLSKIDDSVNTLNKDITSSLDSISSEITNNSSTNTGLLQQSFESQTSDITDSLNINSQSISKSIDNSSSELSYSLDSNFDRLLNFFSSQDNSSDPDASSDPDTSSESCTPDSNNRFCESEHGVDEQHLNEIRSYMENSIDEIIEERNNDLPFSDEFSTKYLNSNGASESPYDEFQLMDKDIFDFVISFFTLNPIYRFAECVDLEFDFIFTKFVFTCRASDQFKSLFGFMIFLYTFIYTVNFLFSSFVPNGSHSSK